MQPSGTTSGWRVGTQFYKGKTVHGDGWESREWRDASCANTCATRVERDRLRARMQ